jgi:aspartate 1-decarboxylase
MLITVCKSKIHRATVTGGNINYEGSITIDPVLIKKAGLIPFEKVQVANATNGNRFETYVIEGKKGAGEIILNGAAAHKGKAGDTVIIIAYAHIDAKKAKKFKPSLVYVDSHNRPIKK